MTSHSAQGQTFRHGAIVDLCIGAGSNLLSSYVALTRVTIRTKLLIYRPFPHKIFQQGRREGPELLLRFLKGEKLDWVSLEAKHTPKSRCVQCHFVKFKEQFNLAQWARKEKCCVAEYVWLVRRSKAHRTDAIVAVYGKQKPFSPIITNAHRVLRRVYVSIVRKNNNAAFVLCTNP